MAKGARGKPGPNGMAGRHGSFERAQGSPNAGRAPGGAGECGQLGGRQWVWQAVAQRRCAAAAAKPLCSECLLAPSQWSSPSRRDRTVLLTKSNAFEILLKAFAGEGCRNCT